MINEIISYIENDAELAIPIEQLFNDDGTPITKNQYGKILLTILCQELRHKFCKHEHIISSDGLDECSQCGAKNY